MENVLSIGNCFRILINHSHSRSRWR